MALAVVLALPGNAAAIYTRSFRVYNFSSGPLEFYGVVTGDTSSPPVRSVLQPGVGYDDFQQTYRFGQTTEAVARYLVEGTTARFYVHMQIFSITQNKVYCTVDFGGACSPEGSAYFHGDQMTYLDPAGTVHDVPASRSQAQGVALKQFCAYHNFAICTFTLTRVTELDSPAHRVSGIVVNNTDVAKQFLFSDVTDRVGTTSSVSIPVKPGDRMTDVAGAASASKYGPRWTLEHVFAYQHPFRLDCPPRSECWVRSVAAMLRYTGNFTVKLGNTTWNVPGVYFDTPDPGRGAFFDGEAAPIGKHARTVLPAGVSVLKRKSGVYTTPAETGVIRPELRLSIAGPRAVYARQVVTYRIILSRIRGRNNEK